MIHVTIGDGAGKTTAAAGLAVRAAGRGMRVLFVQFLKDGSSGEIAVLRKIENITVLHAPVHFGFLSRMALEQRRAAASACLDLLDAVLSFRGSLRNPGQTQETFPGETPGTGKKTDTDLEMRTDLNRTNASEAASTGINTSEAAGTGTDTNPCKNANPDAAPDTGATGADLVVLDEVLHALDAGLIGRADLEPLLAQDWELVLTGRTAPDWLTERADYVSEVRKRKHPFDRGVRAREGIEY